MSAWVSLTSLLPLLAFGVSVARYRPSSPPSLFQWLGIGRCYRLVAPPLFSRLGIVRHHTPGPLAIVWHSSLVEHSLLDGKLVDESVGLSPGAWRVYAKGAMSVSINMFANVAGA